MFLWGCFEIAAPKTLELSKKTYVGEFPFDKFVRPQSTAHRTKNSTTDIFWKCLERKECSKISKISKTFLCNTNPFSLTLQACSSELLTSTKSDSKKNVSCECSLKQLQIWQKKGYNKVILLQWQDYHVEFTRFWKKSFHKFSRGCSEN